MVKKKYSYLLIISLLYLIPFKSDCQEKLNNDKKFRVVALPTIDYNRSLGFKIGATSMGFFDLNEKDSISPVSSVGLMGFWSTNNSWVVMAHTQLFLSENKYRIKAAAGLVDFNSQYYEEDVFPGGLFVDFNTTSDFVYFLFAFKLRKNLYLGPQVLFSKRETLFDLPGDSGNEQRAFNGLGGALEWDDRSNVYNSHSGLYAKLSGFSYNDWLGSDVEFNNLQLEINKYFPLDSNRTIATRFFGYFALGNNIPFEAQRSVGRKDIRGYTQGEFRGEQIISAQAEYRWTFYNKWGMVAFAGLAISNDPEGWSQLLPGGGAGIRYMMIPDKRINAGIDIAGGVRDWGIYFRITEAF
ncbi:BamA/TamA family outer membrane protein [Marinigracilibium pacificum]|uniref:BamA/TamA family outer membrane protein n=1 Tax=Marinigracilibium pacificum TaxID=2729599 RepID=A0A848IUV7_9BACT|nr:BamA/TamA family outer membrane protein [Marinigracilibium pacificum]NMM48283.1 BamA/TamA family outer membrane protein [Marinigracilibium pacificum]